VSLQNSDRETDERSRIDPPAMARSNLLSASFVLFALQALVNGQTTSETPTSVVTDTADGGGTPTTFRDVFTIPASADQGQQLLPNIQDPEAVDAQVVCPGYTASQLQENDGGLGAVLTLAGAPCNVYGNDVEVLNLKVEYQSANRLAIQISPAHVVGRLWSIKQRQCTNINRILPTRHGTFFPKNGFLVRIQTPPA
jgi:hypothetical protein